MIVEHVIRNAQEATPDEGPGRRERRARRRNGMRSLVADSGAGMSPEFIRDRLFKPSTRPRAARAWASAPTRCANTCSRSAAGSWSTARKRGTRIELHLPAQTANSPAESSHAP